MNAILLKICLFLVLTLPGYQHLQNKKIVVIGIADKAKDGAVVSGPKGHVYYINGLDFWDDKFYRKRVRVSGILVIQRFSMTDGAEDLAHPLVNKKIEVRTIMKPKWELVK